ncbi:hypothetical protein LOZ58_003693 [Ophidiomyces ophidiicola]|nr:hypothetical protein LOZ65_003336 [Ophidiomyces ophidiicola]KAI1942087.1 hypothetical protein LOZ66_001569 [Ophidiomyces ophidiicola]KAI1960621.1 hypothetical protein LOZ58_003693 [Ophidiomyces ophidiicola]
MEDPKSTNIDRRTCKRVVPMRVICAGLPRSGTASLREALTRLGFDHTYHMISVLFENPPDAHMWIDAIRAKFDGVGTFEKEQWDQLLGHCQAVCDVPPALFIPELVKAYPEAKVIVNIRDFEGWYRSMNATVAPVTARAVLKDPSSFKDPRQHTCFEMSGLIWKNMFGDKFYEAGEELHREHYAMVRSLVPEENRLEYNIKEGWGPLCEFLGVPVPDEPFPHLNDSKTFIERSLRAFDIDLNDESPVDQSKTA